MTIRYRPHRELLEDAMREVRTFASWAELVDYLRREQGIEVAAIEPHGYDKRIGWDTHIVIGRYPDGHESPIGWTDGCVEIEGPTRSQAEDGARRGL